MITFSIDVVRYVFLPCVVALLFAASPKVAGADEHPEVLECWGKPRILFEERLTRWKGVAFSEDGKTLTGSLVNRMSRNMVLAMQSRGEVYSFDMSAKVPKARLITDARNQDIDIVRTSTGVCPDPLTLFRWSYRKPREAIVYKMLDGEVDKKSLRRIAIDLPAAHRWNTLQLMTPALMPLADTLVFGKRYHEANRDRVEWFGWVVAWNMEKEKACFVDAWGKGGVNAIACSPDGKWVVAVGKQPAPSRNRDRYCGRVVCWNSKFTEKRFDLSLNQDAECLMFSPDSKLLAVGESNGVVTWVDLVKNESVGSVDTRRFTGRRSSCVQSVAFSPDGKTLAAGTGSWRIGDKWGQLCLIEVSKNRVRTVPDSEMPHVVTCVAFSPDGRSLIAGSASGKLKWWRRTDKEESSRGEQGDSQL